MFLIAIVWVVFAINFFGTIIKRRERHLYVALWFYIATITTIAMLHIVNSLAIPVRFSKSYSVFAGVQDALVQWWYGHNAVGFLLTTPFLGMMYYFLPKAANRPVYSYRLSIIHFWALVFVYIWAGPHHLHYTALPDWAQTLGMVFSLILLAPSWGGMLNGLLTLRGAWNRVRESAILKFFVLSVTFYGMSTFEGPMLAIKSVNKLTHYTDWTIAHVHAGALGWVGFMIFGSLYYMIPKLWKRKLYSEGMATMHFWIATIGLLLYVIPIWSAGLMQGLMWRAFDADGLLVYPNFVETTQQILPFYHLRMLGGFLYIVGLLLMFYNVMRTIKGVPKADLEDVEVQAPSLASLAPPVAKPTSYWHHFLESKPMTFVILVIVVAGVGGMIEIGPLLMPKSYVPMYASAAVPYTPLELEGRDIYLREGCVNCHSQMIRPLRDEVLRYGDLFQAGRIGIRSPLPMGLPPYRAGLSPCWRQVSRPLALPAFRGPARDVAGIDYAALSMAYGKQIGCIQDQSEDESDAEAAGAVYDGGNRQRGMMIFGGKRNRSRRTLRTKVIRTRLTRKSSRSSHTYSVSANTQNLYFPRHHDQGILSHKPAMPSLAQIGVVLFFLLFLGIVYWTYRGRKNRFEHERNLPLKDGTQESENNLS